MRYQSNELQSQEVGKDMVKTTHTTDDVFGISRELPLNYVSRKNVDEVFIDSLSQGKHIVIYGSSKQGKTSLRKKCLSDNDYVVISCQNKWTLADLHAAILKSAGFSVKQSTTKTVSGSNKIAVEGSAGFSIPLFGKATAKAGNEDTATDSESVTFHELELDPDSTNDIIRALEAINFSKFIVLEDFHYLPDDTQRDFSFSLKAFHESSKFTFIVVAVWREENRLIGFNGDLTDRVISVDVDTWGEASLREVITDGGMLLNISFSEEFVQAVLGRAFESVHIVQELCRRAARGIGIYETQDVYKVVGEGIDVPSLSAEIVSQQTGRYKGFLFGFVDGFQETDLEMPKWIIYALLCFPVEELEKGVRLRTITRIIKSQHPRGDKLNNGNITQILISAASLQNKKNIRPLVIDYDTTNTRLHVVDKGFLGREPINL
ncbi:hypothetical protein [Novosphingobium pituita]|uniref:ATP-binding protein n=1 Tax=Novosphingobium pituita TaxID=3056842 RepID=A0ABQ6PAR4_9SPHN|nr:hypothetical protein [Novosphingobium sp. IK01]GMM62335.1 hypothetical protein NUTIK01_31120 [Novosphingobium sp. IK01]